MSDWLVILVCIVALGGLTYLAGEWLSHRLVTSRTPRWIRREEPRHDPLARRDDERG